MWLALCIGFWVLSANAATTTTRTEVVYSTGANGVVTKKTITHATTVNSIGDIKNSLVATSVVNEQTLFDSIQAYRKSQSKKVTLKYSTKLSEVARNYAKYLSDNNLFSHSDKQGNDAWKRLEKAGFKFSYWGELLGEATDPAQALSAFKASKLHNEIMLKDDYTIAGIGYYKGKWVVLVYYDKDFKYADKTQAAKPVKIIKKKRVIKKVSGLTRRMVSLPANGTWL